MLETELARSVRESLGYEFEISDLRYSDNEAEILARISSHGYLVNSYDAFANVLDLLVSQLRSSASWVLGGAHCAVSISGKWFPEPTLVRLKLESSVKKGSRFLNGLQQPLGVLLLGTLLGSILVPLLNDISNRNKLRHEERVKVAIMIVEQSHETDRRLFNLMDYLVLFRKDHNDPRDRQAFLKKEQYNARKTFNEMYLSFQAQAWWWHWNVKSESSLSAIATPEESRKIGELAREYSDALSDCTQALTQLWDPFLKNAYKPDDPQNDALISRASERLNVARTTRNKIALQMAQVLASR